MIKLFHNRKKDMNIDITDLFYNQIKVIKKLENENNMLRKHINELKDDINKLENIKEFINKEYPSVKQAMESINDPNNFLFSLNESIKNLESIDNLPNDGLILAESLYRFSLIHIKDDSNKKFLSIVYFAYAKVLEIEMGDLLKSIFGEFGNNNTLGSLFKKFKNLCKSNNLKYKSINLDAILHKRNDVAHRGDANLKDVELIRNFFFKVDKNKIISIGEPYRELCELIQLLKNRK